MTRSWCEDLPLRKNLHPLIYMHLLEVLIVVLYPSGQLLLFIATDSSVCIVWKNKMLCCGQLMIVHKVSFVKLI